MSRLAKVLNPASEKRDLTPYERFRAQLNQVRHDVSGLVGEKNVDRFIRVCLNAVQANPDVLSADRRSLLLACMKAAQDGLLPDGREAVFNVYNTKDRDRSRAEGRDVWVSRVQYLPMAYGLIQKIYEAGATYVDAVPVYERDEFDYQRGDEPKISHKPYGGSEEPGNVVAAYVIVKLKTGETKREVMWRREIERVRLKSKSPDGLMWKDFYDQGSVKSVIHRVVKQLPRSEGLERTIAHDNEAIGLEDVAAVPAELTGTNLEALVDGRITLEKTSIPAERETVPAGGGDDSENPAPPNAEVAAPANEEQGAGGAGPAPEPQGAGAAGPKKRGAGTPAMKKKFLDSFAASNDLDVLSIKRDEANFHQWSAEDLAEIDAAYRDRRIAITAGGSAED